MENDIPNFPTPESYEQFAINVEARSPERAKEARRRAIRLRAQLRGAKTDIERECLEAVFAYERTLFLKHGRRQPAAYTWRTIQAHGIIAAVDRLVSRQQETTGYRALVAEGMESMAFEAVVLRHPDAFSRAAVAQSARRMNEWTKLDNS